MSRYRHAMATLLILLPTFSQSQPARSAEVTSDEYAVYSALLDAIKQSPKDGREVKLFVVVEKTGGPDTSCLPEELAKWQRKIQSDELKPLLADLLARNDRSYPLGKRLTLSREYILLSAEDLSEIFFKKPGDEGWDDFFRLYPSSPGYITFSRVGFNKDATKAIIYREVRCGPLCGYGGYVLLRKDGGRWREEKGFSCWLS